MTAVQAIIMAVLQGVTELFPISSLGHAVILPAMLDLPLDQRSPEYLPFLVVLHVGTAVALLLYFAKDWIGIAGSLIASPSAARDINRGILVKVIVASTRSRKTRRSAAAVSPIPKSERAKLSQSRQKKTKSAIAVPRCITVR